MPSSSWLIAQQSMTSMGACLNTLIKRHHSLPVSFKVQEKVKEWQGRLGSSLGLQIEELTGDTDINQDAGRAENADVICTTPEKFGESTQLHSAFAHSALVGGIVGSAPEILARAALRHFLENFSACRRFHHKAQDRPGWGQVPGRGMSTCLSRSRLHATRMQSLATTVTES